MGDNNSYKMIKINLDWGNIQIHELAEVFEEGYKVVDCFTEKVGDREWGDRWRIYFLKKIN